MTADPPCACRLGGQRGKPRLRRGAVDGGPAAGASLDITERRPRTCQSLVIRAKGEQIRTLREPKSTITASSSSTWTTQPRPYLSWVTRSRTVNCSTGGSMGRTLKGLPGRKRRDAARAGFINTSMRPSGRGDPIPAERILCGAGSPPAFRVLGYRGRAFPREAVADAQPLLGTPAGMRGRSSQPPDSHEVPAGPATTVPSPSAADRYHRPGRTRRGHRAPARGRLPRRRRGPRPRGGVPRAVAVRRAHHPGPPLSLLPHAGSGGRRKV